MAIEQDRDYVVRIAVLESQLHGLRDNIVLQAKEYERRLSELNHEYQRQTERNAQYVSREAWELRSREIERAMELRNKEVDSRLLAGDKWRWISIGASGAGGGLLGAFISKLFSG